MIEKTIANSRQQKYFISNKLFHVELLLSFVVCAFH